MKRFETKLNNLINVLLETLDKNEKVDSENGFRLSRKVFPEKYVKQGKAKKGYGFELYGKRYEEFDSILRYLRNLEETSHLEIKELTNLLWNIVFQVIFEIYYS